MINLLTGSFIFILSLAILAVIPGWAIIKRLDLNLNLKETLLTSVTTGIASTTLTSFILGLFNARAVFFPLILLVDVAIIFNNHKKLRFKNFPKVNIEKTDILLLVIILTGVIGQTSLVIRSGLITPDGGLEFTEFRDAMWHIGLIEELTKKVPPIHPGFAPEPLTNYHYFYDLFVANIYKPSRLPLLDLYFRYIPVLLSSFLGLSVFVLARRIISEKAALWSVFLTFFAGSFSYFAPFFVKELRDWGPSTFWIDQTFSMLINPPLSLSFSLLLTAVFLLSLFRRRPSTKLLIVVSLFFGTIIAYKVYAGILVLGSLSVVGFWEFWQNRNNSIIKIFLVSSFLSLLVFLPTNARGAGNFLIYAPLWYLNALVENPDRLNIVDWVLREQTYTAEGNVMRVAQIRLTEFLLYLFGNFGVRMVGIVGLFYFLKKKILITSEALFLGLMALGGFVLPLLFIQRGSVANTIQFSYYSLIIVNMITSNIIARILEKRNIIFQTTLIVIVMLLSVPTSFKVFVSTVTSADRTVISKEEVEAFSFLRARTKPDSIILLPSSQRNTHSLYVSALSSRRTFYSDRLMTENTHKDFKKREDEAAKFFLTKDYDWSRHFLKDNKINYIYYQNTDVPDFQPQMISLKEVFQTDKISIYKVE